MKTLYALGTALALLAPLSAFATCTPDEAEAKAKQLAAKVKEVTEQNPQKAKEINEELNKMPVKSTAESLPDDCAAYDRRLKELDEADRRADPAPAKSSKSP
ncbi:hypothetical protein [Pseudomonas mangiferae]|uniref:Uncharacterized protein n=1 Tax=Pseudomonas mangiferae TaxID=2593654 RepID=A0A553GUT7_9PSED|nr:hypothetical protein [Pseudomonas mangiferae]TRX73216.1 hypothetical protein FM069_18755 [Pseudomonas mangiferae]